MLIETLIDAQTYFKSTLLQVLQEIKTQKNIPIPVSYRSIIRREKDRIKVYLNVRRDPANGWRMYTGKQIKDIVSYELDRQAK